MNEQKHFEKIFLFFIIKNKAVAAFKNVPKAKLLGDRDFFNKKKTKANKV